MKPSDIKRCPFCGSVKPIIWDEDKKEWVYFTAPLTDEEKESRDRILKMLEDVERTVIKLSTKLSTYLKEIFKPY